MAKSTHNNVVEIKKCVNLGHFPVFVSMTQRHFEKAQPNGTSGPNGTTIFTGSVDMLRMSVSNEEVLGGIESIEFAYRPHA